VNFDVPRDSVPKNRERELPPSQGLALGTSKMLLLPHSVGQGGNRAHPDSRG